MCIGIVYNLSSAVRHGFAPEMIIYWGYFPAGVGGAPYQILNLIGK
jgi:hypothetical protein